MPCHERWIGDLGNPSKSKTLHLRTTATAILGVKEDDVAVSKLYVGDKLGQLHILQLPEFTLVSTSTISHASLRSMCMNDESELLIADAEGRIFAADTMGNLLSCSKPTALYPPYE